MMNALPDGLVKWHRFVSEKDEQALALDNIFVERLWRTVKYEEVYLKDYQTVAEAVSGLTDYFVFYNEQRLHQALNYQTPASVYWSKEGKRAGS